VRRHRPSTRPAPTHLVDEVGVPAILGFGRSQEVLDLANRHFVPKGVLALASNPAAMLSSIPHPAGEVRLVYRMTTSRHDDRAPPSVALVRQAIEPALRGPGGPLGPTGTCAWRSSAVHQRPRAPATPTRC
jgi:hypothetical protein